MTEHDELNQLRIDEQIRKALASILEKQSKLQTDVGQLRNQSESIYKEVVKTNGRVTRSEERLSELEKWREKSAGVWAAIVAFATFVAWLIGQVTGFIKDHK